MKITNPMIESVIHVLGEKFDSHDVILALSKNHTQEYNAARAEYGTMNKLHSQIGIKIEEICSSRGFSKSPSRSKDMAGRSSKCLSWRKS